MHNHNSECNANFNGWVSQMVVHTTNNTGTTNTGSTNTGGTTSGGTTSGPSGSSSSGSSSSGSSSSKSSSGSSGGGDSGGSSSGQIVEVVQVEEIPPHQVVGIIHPQVVIVVEIMVHPAGDSGGVVLIHGSEIL